MQAAPADVPAVKKPVRRTNGKIAKEILFKRVLYALIAPTFSNVLRIAS